MAKELTKKLKLVIPAGQAVPGQQLGPALGGAGVNIGEFIKRFNAETAAMAGDQVPVEISVYKDRSFDLVYKTPPTSSLLLKAAGVEKGSGKTPVTRAGTVTRAQVREIAERKLPDLSVGSLEAAERTILGTARSMGIEVRG
jgi:large subunit ribosomal protein L11